MHKVMVAVDESSRSLKGLALGQALAEQLAVPLSLYSVVPDEASMADRRYAVKQALQAAHADEIEPQLEMVAATSEVNALTRLAQDDPQVLLCMATAGRGAVTGTLLGSVAGGVVKEAGRPVLLAGPRFSDAWRGPIKELLVCLDGSPLSEAVLPEALALARLLKAQLKLVQAIDPGDLSTERAADVDCSAYLQRVCRQLQEAHGVAAEWEVLNGEDPAQAVADYCRDLPGSLIVMTTHGRSGLSRLVLGSVAQEVVHRANGPVALLRPQA